MALFVLLVSGASCGYLAVRFAPRKTGNVSESELARESKRMLRESLRQGAYDRLPETRRLLTAAYLENPRDWEVSFLLGMAHLWQAAERHREERQDPRITDHLILSDKYLSEARRLNPKDFRVPGFEGSVKMALGSIHQDERLKREGYFILLKGTKKYPEFNFFTMSFVLSNAPRESPRFADAVDYAWKNIDVCVGRKVERSAASARRLEGELRTALSPNAAIAGGSSDRACRNPSSAPHNMEGFLLHMGDLLVKKGDPEAAEAIYGLARLPQSFAVWPYADLLEKRVVTARQRAQLWASGQEAGMLFNSAQACVACHETRGAAPR